jgi:uncharacterized protein (DUF4415 family)
MENRKPLIDEEVEVREITAEDVALFKPFSALPAAERRVLLKLRKRGPQKTPRKVPISIRLSPDVAEGLRATGNGWQGRADEALRSWLAGQSGTGQAASRSRRESGIIAQGKTLGRAPNRNLQPCRGGTILDQLFMQSPCRVRQTLP